MRTEWVRSANGGPAKLAAWLPETEEWYVCESAKLLNRERFHGNYKILRKERAE